MVCINEMSAGMGEKKLDFCFPIKLAKNSLLSNIFQKNGNSNKLLSELYHEYNFFKELIVWEKSDYSNISNDISKIEEHLSRKMLNRSFSKEIDWLNDKSMISENFIPELKQLILLKRMKMKIQNLLYQILIYLLVPVVISLLFVLIAVLIIEDPIERAGNFKYIIGAGFIFTYFIYLMVASTSKGKQLIESVKALQPLKFFTNLGNKSNE